MTHIPVIRDCTWHSREQRELEQPVGNLDPDLYQYTKDLLLLEACRAGTSCVLLEEATAITTLLRASAWERALANHSDKVFTRYILTGISQGFHIGFDGRSQACGRGSEYNS